MASRYLSLQLLFLLIGVVHLEFAASQNMEKLLKVVSQSDHNDALVKQQPDYQELLHASYKLQNVWKQDILGRMKDLALTSDCTDSLEYILANTTRMLHLLDAMGKPGAGILDGNLNIVASFDECFNYNYTAFCYSAEVEILGIKDWKLGMCVPKYCTSEDIAEILQDVDITPKNNTLMCTNTKSPGYETGAIIMLVICSLFAAMVITATVIDIFMQILNLKLSESQSVNPDIKEKLDEETPLVSKNNTKMSRVRPLDFVMAFSLFKTVPTLLATKEGSGIITSLNGIRVISMSWVILGHTYAFAISFTSVDNPVTIISAASRLSFQVIGSAYFSVDSFFFLSGVLVAYLTLRETKKKGRFPFLHYYAHRYLRITPTYAFVLFFATYLGDHLVTGPFMSLFNPIKDSCTKYWWTNLLYINNLYPWKLGDQCLGWGWYLANDMQFYIIAPTMLIAAYYLLPVGAIIAGAFIASGFIIDSTLTGVYDFQANELSGIAYQYVGKPNITQAYTDAIYGKPWDRISPYIVGLALGYVLYKNIKFDYNKVLNLVFHGFLWAVATFTAFWLVYGLYFTWHGHIPSKAENVIYIMLSRCLWACCLALLVYVCHHGYGWVVNSFLSMKLWTPLARMTFNAYLIHPVVIFPIYGHLQVPIHYTDVTLACYFIAFVVLAYAAAGVLCVAVELPLSTIEMLLFKLMGVNRRGSQRQDTVEAKAAEA